MQQPGHLISLNVATPREIERGGEIIRTAIWKQPVAGRRAVEGVNIDGDDQADRTVHGGIDKAVYAYASEDYEWWSHQLGKELDAGTFGENLTLSGVDVSGALIGERWRVGSVLLEVSEPRFPCWKLGVRMDDPGFLKQFAKALRPGAYLRIVEAGELGAGDAVEIVERPGHEATIELFARAYLEDRQLIPQVLAAQALSDSWHDWFSEQLAK
ncbi:MAG: MOSC domain-containing protein [Thermoleophilaceae bacterium]|nr:MOSC domain-containing protein [Thermoleophilaceae bacterium]